MNTALNQHSFPDLLGQSAVVVAVVVASDELDRDAIGAMITVLVEVAVRPDWSVATWVVSRMLKCSRNSAMRRMI